MQNHSAVNETSYLEVCQTRGRRELTIDFTVNEPFELATGRPRNRGTLMMEILLQNRERRKEKQVTAHILEKHVSLLIPFKNSNFATVGFLFLLSFFTQI